MPPSLKIFIQVDSRQVRYVRTPTSLMKPIYFFQYLTICKTVFESTAFSRDSNLDVWLNHGTFETYPSTSTEFNSPLCHNTRPLFTTLSPIVDWTVARTAPSIATTYLGADIATQAPATTEVARVATYELILSPALQQGSGGSVSGWQWHLQIICLRIPWRSTIIKGIMAKNIRVRNMYINMCECCIWLMVKLFHYEVCLKNFAIRDAHKGSTE